MVQDPFAHDPNDPTETLAAQASNKKCAILREEIATPGYNFIFTSQTVGALLRSTELTKARFRFARFPPPSPPPESLLAGQGICYIISGKRYIRLT